MRLYSLCSRSCAPTAALWPPDTQSYLLSTVTDRDTLSYTFQRSTTTCTHAEEYYRLLPLALAQHSGGERLQLLIRLPCCLLCLLQLDAQRLDRLLCLEPHCANRVLRF